jgi:hypothetical protein
MGAVCCFLFASTELRGGAATVAETFKAMLFLGFAVGFIRGAIVSP